MLHCVYCLNATASNEKRGGGVPSPSSKLQYRLEPRGSNTKGGQMHFFLLRTSSAMRIRIFLNLYVAKRVKIIANGALSSLQSMYTEAFKPYQCWPSYW